MKFLSTIVILYLQKGARNWHKLTQLSSRGEILIETILLQNLSS